MSFINYTRLLFASQWIQNIVFPSFWLNWAAAVSVVFIRFLCVICRQYFEKYWKLHDAYVLPFCLITCSRNEKEACFDGLANFIKFGDFSSFLINHSNRANFLHMYLRYRAEHNCSTFCLHFSFRTETLHLPSRGITRTE